MNRSLLVLSAATLSLVSCIDFEGAEAQYCLAHLDVCTTHGTYLNDAVRYQAVATADQVFDEGAANGQTARFSFVYDDHLQTLGLQITGQPSNLLGVDLIEAPFGFTGRPLASFSGSQGSVVLTPDEIEELKTGRIGVHVRTGSGALRGQIVPEGAWVLTAVINPAETVPPSGGPAAEGFVAAIVTTDHKVLLTNTDGSPVGLFEGVAGTSGSGTIGSIQGSGSNELTVDPSVLLALQQGLIYADSGTARAQLVPVGDLLFVAHATASEVVPPGTGSMVVNAQILLSPDGTAIIASDLSAGQSGVFRIGMAGTEPDPSVSGYSFPTGTAGISLDPAYPPALLRRLVFFELDGQVRGQFLRPGEMLSVATLTSGDLPTPSPVTGGGNAQIVMRPDREDYLVEAVTTLSDANALWAEPLDQSVTYFELTPSAPGNFSAAGTSPAGLAARIRDDDARLLVATPTYPGGAIGGKLHRLR